MAAGYHGRMINPDKPCIIVMAKRLKPVRKKIGLGIVAMILMNQAAVASTETCREGIARASMLELELELQHQRERNAAYTHQPAPESTFNKDYADLITIYKKNCRKGDTMRVPILFGNVWQEQCDFNKTIVKSSDRVVCVKK